MAEHIRGATHVEVEAEVRYWEDATVNGVEDERGDLMPLRRGKLWCPTIRLTDGVVVGWPAGVIADVHYKVCDQGEYWLRDDSQRIAKWSGHYVPDDVLCVGDRGYGDYIIMKIGADGRVQGWCAPVLDGDDWHPTPADAQPRGA